MLELTLTKHKHDKEMGCVTYKVALRRDDLLTENYCLVVVSDKSPLAVGTYCFDFYTSATAPYGYLGITLKPMDGIESYPFDVVPFVSLDKVKRDKFYIRAISNASGPAKHIVTWKTLHRLIYVGLTESELSHVKVIS